MTETLSRQALNRATLARQYLLDRIELPALDAIEHLAGMQAQASLAPYVGLWTRLRDFDAGELSQLTEQRAVVRLHLMRNTVHLVSAQDCLDWRLLFYPLHVAEFTPRFRDGMTGVDLQALLAQARTVLAQQPLTRAELGKQLAHGWPEADPKALAYAATHHIALCQIPPRGIWGRSGPAAWTPVAEWLGAPLRSTPVDGLVTRYLGAFGPATVADIQLWSGLTRLREIVDRLDLRIFQGPHGETLYDLPDAPRPDADTPAPPRFLPAYDNVLLSHKDRSRLIADGRPVPLPPGHGATDGTLLVDGMWQGTWRISAGALRITTFTPLCREDRDAVLAEAGHLAALVDPTATVDLSVVI